jgi:hypothetical protein
LFKSGIMYETNRIQKTCGLREIDTHQVDVEWDFTKDFITLQSTPICIYHKINYVRDCISSYQNPDNKRTLNSHIPINVYIPINV